MYGDCQVAAFSSSMGSYNNWVENGISSLFSSRTRNPNYVNDFNFMGSIPDAFHSFPCTLQVKEERRVNEMLESMSGSELNNIEGQGGLSGNELDSQPHSSSQLPNKKKRYHRHTTRQIQELEALFRECPHPDDKQRLKLSQELGLKPRQVKFWFQNRRTQMKAQQDRTDNVILRAENDNIQNENYRLQAVLRSLYCPGCGGGSILGQVEHDEQQLRIENARLKEELDRVCAIASKCSGRPPQYLGPQTQFLPSPPPSLDLDMSIYTSRHHFHEPIPAYTQMIPLPMLSRTNPLFPNGNVGGLFSDDERPLVMELAISSMNELLKMCHLNEPLWVRDSSNSTDLLDKEEYSRIFSWHGDRKQHCDDELKIEATREKALVFMNSINWVDAFLDANKWAELFPSIVSRARTIQVLAAGVAGHPSGSLHLMHAELQVLSPLVPTREIYFLRYVYQNVEEGMWTIVDFPVDNFNGSLQLSYSMLRYRRRPSGCIIHDVPNGYSKVTWVEHGEILDEKPTHQIFDQHIRNGLAFGAKRWLAVLQRQCERVASLMARNVSDLGVIQSAEARKNFLKLGQRMIRTFCMNISSSGGQSWTALSESREDTVRITTRKIVEPGQPSGLILTAVSTTWLPYSHDRVFDLLRNQHQRSQIEALSNGSTLHEVAHIANGSHPGNSMSLSRINVASNSSQNVELMLQESSTDPSGSLVVYTTMEVNYVQLVMSGEETSQIPLLPTGFSIIPLSPTSTASEATTTELRGANNRPRSGCLLTVGVQVHISTNPNSKLNLSSVTSISNNIQNVAQQINVALNKDSFGCSSASANNNDIDIVSACPAVTSNSAFGSYSEPTHTRSK